MGLHWNGEITLGNVLMMLGFIAASVAFYYNTNWRLKIVEKWQNDHQVGFDGRAKGLSELGEAIVNLKQIALGQERRITMLEDRQ